MPTTFSSARPHRLGVALPLLLTLLIALGLTPATFARTAAAPASASPASAIPPVPSPMLASVSVNPASIVGGSSSTGTVTVSSSGSGLANISLSSNNAAVQVPSGVSLSAATRTVTFPITTTAVSSATPVTITASQQYSAGANGYQNIVVKATLTVNPAPAIPAYLSNLTLNSTTVTGGNSTGGTVTISSPAPANGVTVTLRSNNSAVTVSPPTITIPASATQATFNVTTTAMSTSVAVAISATYNSFTQGHELSVLPSSLPSGPSFNVSSVQVAPGNGCAVVDWTRLSAVPVKGYNVYRISGGTRTLLTSTPFVGNYYPDTGLTNDTTTYSYQVSAMDILGQEHALSTPVSATPSSAATTLNWINAPSAVIDNFALDVSLSSGGQVFGAFFYIDGVQMGGGNSFSRLINGAQTNIAGTSFDSSKLPNGPHVVQFIGFVDSNGTVACVSPPITIQVSNTISNFHLDGSWFSPQQGELCYVSATAPAGSTWTVQATSADGTSIIRTWQGASSLVNVAWDGKDASGSFVSIDDYAIQLTVQPPGTSPQAALPTSTTSIDPAPNAATAFRKTRPVKMQAGQPIALAFISIGASYYVDSNGAKVPTPYADIALSDVTLKNAYTTLYGAGNFRIIRSDTFDPTLVVGKDALGNDLTALQQLKSWLGVAQVFYLFGHGAGAQGLASPSLYPRSTAFGSIDDTGIHMEFFPSTNVSFDKNNDSYVFVPTYVGTHQYVFAWVDSCNSAGGNAATGEIGTLDPIWVTAFNANTFIGNNGYGIVNNSGTTGLSPWYTWRNKFWGKMAVGQTVTQAYLNCWSPVGAVDQNTYYAYYTLLSMTYTCTPGDGYGGNPRVVLYGHAYDTTLVPQ